MNIFLIGFMGAGKSTIAARLKQLYGMQVVEMDRQIVEEEGMSIPQIFEQKGETYFRDAETNLLKKIALLDGMAVSCGGGLVLRQENVELMRKCGKVIFLQAEPETILKRVKNDHNRPLLEGKKSVEGIRELLGQRKERYLGAADEIVTVDRKTADEIAEEVYIISRR